MTISELKEYIFQENKIEFVLQELGCHSIRRHSNYISAGNPDGDNKSAITVYCNPYLTTKNYTRDIGDNADLIDLVMLIKQCTFKSAVKWLHEILGLKFTATAPPQPKEQKPDPLAIFKKVKKSTRCNVLDIEPIEHDVPEFTPHIHISWFREGIMPWTVAKFGLGYSYKHKRNVIPLRYWATGDLLGFNQRTVIENYEELNIPKYFITPKYPKHMNVFGLWENYDNILQAGYCVVYEAEKSVLKRHSLNDKTGVAISGHDLSEEQVRILIGLNVDIVIAFDNDIDIQTIRAACNKFYGIRNVYYMKDKHGLLGPKDSPADAPNKIYNFLFKYRVKYDVEERKKYLQSLEGDED